MVSKRHYDGVHFPGTENDSDGLTPAIYDCIQKL